MAHFYATIDKCLEATKIKASFASQHSTEVLAKNTSSADRQATQPRPFSDEIKASESSALDDESIVFQESHHNLVRAIISTLAGDKTSINNTSKRISAHTSSNTTISSFNTLNALIATKTVSRTERDCDEEILIELEKSDYQITSFEDFRNDCDDTDTTLQISKDDSSSVAVKCREVEDNDRDVYTLSFPAEHTTYAIIQLRQQCERYILKI